jgi:hypothetical protein
MIMKRIYFCVLIFLISSLLSAQESREVFAPFVSRLRVTPGEGNVKLTWKDTKDLDGTCVIYRYSEEIRAENFHKAIKVGEVTHGTESFVDYPDSKGPHYYTVLAKDRNGNMYDLFIPFRNKTISGITLDNLGTEQELAATITGIDTQVQKDSILVTFESSKEDRELIIYRSTTPIRSNTDLAYAQPLRVIPSSRTGFQDFPVPGISYYYAILDSGLVKVGETFFRPGENSTILPANIPIGTRVGLPERNISRNLPLPLLPLTLRVDTGEYLGLSEPTRLPEKREIGSATKKAVAGIMESVAEIKPAELEPTVLDEDKGSVVSGGEEYTLKSIVNKEFAEERWLECEKLLKNFLSVHRSDEIETRARFYLGQVLYFQGKHRDSFMQFILIQDALYSNVTPWLDNLFIKNRTS